MKRLIRQSIIVISILALGFVSAWGLVRANAQTVSKTRVTPPPPLVAVPIPVFEPPPAPSPQPLPRRFSLPPARWIGQSYNNCGPASVAELLQYFGYEVDQRTTKARLRTDSADKNVTLDEISDYLRADYGLESRVLVNGNLLTLKRLLAAGIPILVENWLHPDEDIGHVLLLRGYDDDQGVLIADDVYLGPNHTYPYSEFDQRQWQPFDRIYLPVYRLEREGEVREIIGTDWDATAMRERALETARQEIGVQPENPYSWLNLGSNALALGQTELARQAFAESKSLGWPARLLWYRTEPLLFLD